MPILHTKLRKLPKVKNVSGGRVRALNLSPKCVYALPSPRSAALCPVCQERERLASASCAFSAFVRACSKGRPSDNPVPPTGFSVMKPPTLQSPPTGHLPKEGGHSTISSSCPFCSNLHSVWGLLTPALSQFPRWATRRYDREEERREATLCICVAVGENNNSRERKSLQTATGVLRAGMARDAEKAPPQQRAQWESMIRQLRASLGHIVGLCMPCPSGRENSVV